MTKKNSMYINDYEVQGYIVKKTTEQSKEDYLNYLELLIDDLIDLKTYAENSDTKAPISIFFECQARLVTLKNKLNAKFLSEWHTMITYDLQNEVELLRGKLINNK